MKRKLLIVLLAAAVTGLALGGGPAAADPDGNDSPGGVTDPLLLALITDDTAFALADLSLLLNGPGENATEHYGQYPSSSPDSGTCGNNWATDQFDRVFTVKNNHERNVHRRSAVQAGDVRHEPSPTAESPAPATRLTEGLRGR